MMTTTKMILASALLALTTSPAVFAQSARQSPPSAVQLIKKAQAAAEAGKAQEAQELMAKATAMLTEEAHVAAQRAADRAAEQYARRLAEVETMAAREQEKVELELRAREIEFLRAADQEPEAKPLNPVRGRVTWVQAPGLPGAQDPQGRLPQRRLPPAGSMGRRGMVAPGLAPGQYSVSSRRGNNNQDNGMEELLRGIHQELRGIRQELSGIRESLSGGHGQAMPHDGGAGHGMPQGASIFGQLDESGVLHPQASGQWLEAQHDALTPDVQWRYVEHAAEAAPQTGVIYLRGPEGSGSESIQYRVISPQGGGESHDVLLELGYVSGENHEMIILENAETKMHIGDLEGLRVDEATQLRHLETILEAIELDVEVETTEAGEFELSPQIRVRALPHGVHDVQLHRNVVVPVPPAPTAEQAPPLPVRQRVRVINTPSAEDPDVQPEDPFFRSPATAEPATVKPVITAAGMFGG